MEAPIRPKITTSNRGLTLAFDRILSYTESVSAYSKYQLATILKGDGNTISVLETEPGNLVIRSLLGEGSGGGVDWSKSPWNYVLSGTSVKVRNPVVLFHGHYFYSSMYSVSGYEKEIPITGSAGSPTYTIARVPKDGSTFDPDTHVVASASEPNVQSAGFYEFPIGAFYLDNSGRLKVQTIWHIGSPIVVTPALA